MSLPGVAGRNDAKTMRFTFVTHHEGVSSALEPAPAILVRVGKVSISDGPFAETKEQAGGASSPSR